MRLLGGLGLALIIGTAAFAQGDSPFGGFKHDSSAPIDITANSLEVRQAEQIAIFIGEVVAGQASLRLTADRVEVTFDQDAQSRDDGTGAIRNLEARGNVFISNGAETAQGDFASYDVEKGMVRMTGKVVLTQGTNAGKGETLVINLNTGVAKMEGSGKKRATFSFDPKNANNN